ncbi:hypothetical protein [Flocculibacter collagenilyticus]|uniref:hypothetical protein n=1 Tax=Flocculibacter collagenilyticus TaxID=2744479 RepID=UPI0018F42344|nr:hypothetical protein [Flocculibacter collagenilyticus]
MFRFKHKKGILLTSLLTAPLLFLLSVNAKVEVAVHDCNCQAKTSFDASLPISDPHNQCAIPKASNESWLSWLSGKSRSTQFHFLDLLELISRNSADKVPDTTPKNHTS